MKWSPEQLAVAAGGRLLVRSERPISTAFIDSRAPVTDAVFIPIVAARDGHEFVSHAIAGGASAVLLQPGHELPVGDLTVVEVDDTLAALTAMAADARAAIAGPVIAVTGSNGKTTTRAMLAAVLEGTLGSVLSTRGNLNNHLGVPLTLCDGPHEPKGAVIEIGMNAPGEVDALAAVVKPTMAVITSIALEHVEFLGSLEAIAEAETEVVHHVISNGAVIIPSDEPLLAPHVDAIAPRVLRFGHDPDDDVRILEVSVGERTRAVVQPRGGAPLQLSLRPFGAHNARNAAAAIAAAVHLGLPLSDVVQALATVAPVGDRGRATRCGAHLLIADCYNANPGSMEAGLRSLEAARGAGAQTLVAVLGDMLELGENADELHAEIGELAGELGIDHVVTVGRLSAVLSDAARARGVEALHVGDDVDSAVERVAAWVEGGAAAVLVKASRGMRLERVVSALAPRLSAGAND